MTGYGRARQTLHERDITVELRSVNHRYLDVNVKAPRIYGFLEEAAKTAVASLIARGKVDVFISIDSGASGDVRISLNHKILEGYLDALHEMRDQYGLTDDISVMRLARLPDIFSAEKQEADADELTKDVLEVLAAAGADFCAMREREGAKMKEDILSRGQTILQLVAEVEKRSPQAVEEYRAKLTARMNEVLADTTIDPQRILAEAAIYADRTAVAEETVRLRSHMHQMEVMAAEEKPIGRKLDFLVQEMNREANTIGSKANDIELAKIVVDIKSEIEKIREQIQNIE
ncbi:YicC/YloC family endoribonuclease [Butyricicoccus sp.]|uniref:YicC/YloC family endoribonuclease n=1 Tax=Butyricicoccus sp. TaxID=2049021 RepID=UPI003F13E39E